MKRKVISFLLLLALVLGSFSMSFAATIPSDVSATKYETAVKVLLDLDVVSGYPDGTFKPANTITRAELAKLLAVELGLGSAAGTSSFKDMKDHWADKYVAAVSAKGLIKGYPDGTFKPNEVISFNEAVTMIVRALGYTDAYVQTVGTWPSGYIRIAEDIGITNEVDSVANRGNIALMLYNAIKVNSVTISKDLKVVDGGSLVPAVTFDKTGVLAADGTPSNIQIGSTTLEVSDNVVVYVKSEDQKQYKAGDTADAKTGNKVDVKLGTDGKVALIVVNDCWVPLEGLVNFRDLGGIKTTDGKTVKWGMLYRTANLGGQTDHGADVPTVIGAATPNDITYIQSLGLKTIIDLRTDEDRQEYPETTWEGIDVVNIDVWGKDGNKLAMAYASPEIIKALGNHDYAPENVKAMITCYYKYFVKGDAPKAAAKAFMDFMVSNNNPVVWHCTAGKDRTGLTAAILLYALGVPEDAIQQEFLLTNDAYVKLFPGVPIDMVEAYYGVDGSGSYLDTTFSIMKADYGSIDNYLTIVCGLTPENKAALKAKYLQ